MVLSRERRASAPRALGFNLTKWYLDLVTDDGVAVVAHAARLRWGPVRVRYAALLRSASGREPEETASIRQGELPRVAGDVLTWRSDPLRLTGSWRRESAPIEATLLETPGGAIRWSCWMPRGRARVELGGAMHEGRGYAEALRLSVPPSRLPFRTLRWGRHVGDRHAVVWIAWEGASAQQWCWLDGALRPGARLTPTGVDLGDGVAVRFLESRSLIERTPTAGLASLLPRLATRLVGEIGGMREHRLLSRSSLVSAGGGADDAGWTIHEEVTW